MRLYFNCWSPDRTLPDLKGVEVDDLNAARDHAIRAIQSVVATGNTELWRKWALRVSDDAGDEVFDMPFWFIASSVRPQLKSGLSLTSSWMR